MSDNVEPDVTHDMTFSRFDTDPFPLLSRTQDRLLDHSMNGFIVVKVQGIAGKFPLLEMIKYIQWNAPAFGCDVDNLWGLLLFFHY